MPTVIRGYLLIFLGLFLLGGVISFAKQDLPRWAPVLLAVLSVLSLLAGVLVLIE